MIGNKIDAYDLYHSEEFKALLKLLGITWAMPTTEMIIAIPLDGPVQVIHGYYLEHWSTRMVNPDNNVVKFGVSEEATRAVPRTGLPLSEGPDMEAVG